jgi:hypothetical protein
MTVFPPRRILTQTLMIKSRGEAELTFYLIKIPQEKSYPDNDEY